MRIEAKIKKLLERAVPGSGAGEGIVQQGSSVIDQKGQADVEVLGGERSGENASAAAGAAHPNPGSKGDGEKDLVLQGSSQPKDPDEEDLGTPGNDRSPGKAASAKAGPAKPLPTSKAGGETGLVMQGSSQIDHAGMDQVGIPAGQQEQVDITAILDAAGISKEAQAQIQEAFEKAVTQRVEAEIEAASDTLAEAVQELAEVNNQELYESVNSYLNYAVEQWMEKNTLAVETGLRADIVESFITGLKDLFQEHYIEVPEGEYDALEAANKTVSDLESQLNASKEAEVKLAEENRTLKRRQIVERESRDLVATEAEKFAKLTEEVEFTTEEAFAEAIGTLKGRYFTKNPDVKTPLTEADVDQPGVGEDESIQTYVKAISRSLKK